MIGRRKFLFVLAAIVPVTARSQSVSRDGKPKRIGLLIMGSSGGPQINVTEFIGTLRELGWVEGRNVVYDRVYAEGDEARLPALGGQLIARGADLIFVSNNQEAQAALSRTRTIPIVFGAVASPVESGLVKTLARPGGNVTGVGNIGWELGGKRMQLLMQILPNLRRVGVLAMLNTPSGTHEPKLIEQAAGPGVAVIRANLKAVEELDTALTSFAANRVQAVLTTHNPHLLRRRKRIVDFAGTQMIPVIGHRGEMADEGALMSYSSILTEQVRRAAHIANRVLNGTKPADIPVEQPTKFELVVNLKTARALGIAVPQSILAQADRVIE